jgi:hypothetical protein
MTNLYVVNKQKLIDKSTRLYNENYKTKIELNTTKILAHAKVV